MAFCKNCNKEIEDGETYCDACKAEESYLDDLLNFVMQENGDEQKAVHQILKNEEQYSGEVSEDVLIEDHEDEINNMLGDIFGQSVMADGEQNEQSEADSYETDNIQDLLSNLDILSEEDMPQVNAENFGDLSDILDIPDSDDVADSQDDLTIHTDFDVQSETEPEIYADFDVQPETEPEIYADFDVQPETEPEIYADFDVQPETEPEIYADFDVQPETEPEIYADFDEQSEAESEKFMDYASQSETEGADETELFDIDELLGNSQLFEYEASQEEATSKEQNNDFGEDDDILKYLQTLNETEEISDYDEIPDKEVKTVTEEASQISETLQQDEKKASNKPDIKEFFKKIFGNIKEERTPEEVEKLKKQALAKYEADEQKKLNAKVRAEKNKEEKQKKKELDDAAKQEQKLAKEKAAAEKKKKKAEEKKLAKDKKALEKKRILDEIDEYEGSINKIGASIIFLLFGTLLVFIVAGTNIYTYNVAIKNAQKDFDNREYNEAYEQVAGIDILEEDIVLYERIMTVMYVNKQLNSYYNYMVLDRPELALDSLLKGLMRYDKYISYAQQLEITEHLDYVKSMLLQELELEFALTEETAYDIIKSESQEEYSDKIIEMTSNME